MAKQELTPEEIAKKAEEKAALKKAAEEKTAQEKEKAAQEKAAQEKAAKEAKVECMYCGKTMKADKAVTDSNGNTFCSDEHAVTYANTMRQIHQTY